jgi:hypothetical protein
VTEVTTTRHELRYRALTHFNPGRCAVEVDERDDGPWLVVVSDLPGHDGPRVTNAIRVIAAVVARDLLPPRTDWRLVVRRSDGTHAAVEFGEAFAGWFNRPEFRDCPAPAAWTPAEWALARFSR